MSLARPGTAGARGIGTNATLFEMPAQAPVAIAQVARCSHRIECRWRLRAVRGALR